jgi:hypothetical protein
MQHKAANRKLAALQARSALNIPSEENAFDLLQTAGAFGLRSAAFDTG